MVEIKMTFGSADDAIAFLAERAGTKTVTNSTPATSQPAPVSSDPKPVKAQKAAASPSAAPVETASAAAEPAPAPTPAPAPAPATPAGKPLEYASSDLPKRIAEMVGLGHTAAVKALLAEFGAKKGPEIPADKLYEFDGKLKSLEASLTAG